MASDPINAYDATRPQATNKVKEGPTVIPANWDAVENMVGIGMYGLEITQTAGKTATIDYTSLTLVQNTATPPLIFVDLAPTQIAMDWDNGVAMDGRETGLGTGAGWKYIWVYRDAVNGVTSGLWSAATAIGSVAEPDANFKFGRLVGAGYWDGAAAFTAFKQRQNRVTLLTVGTVFGAGRSDAAWSGAQSLSALVPAIATRIKVIMEVNAGNFGGVLFQLAANSSGHYREVQYTILSSATTAQSIPAIQELIDQNIHYWTEETSGTCNVDLFYTGYWIDI